MALRRAMRPSAPIPVPSSLHQAHEASSRHHPGTPHQFISCSLESTLSMPTLPMMALPRHWLSSSSSCAPGADLGLDELAKDTCSLDWGNAAAHLDADEDTFEEPPIQPPYIELPWSLSSMESPDTLVEALHASLQDLSVEVVLDRDAPKSRWRIDGCAFPEGAALRFCLSIFASSAQEGVHLVEVQRRSGDSLSFRGFFTAFVHRLSEQVRVSSMVSESASSSSPLSMSHARISSLSSSSLLDAESVQCLLAMASSECVDVRREALRELARVAMSSQDVLSEDAECFDLLRKCLSDVDHQVVRCAVTVLACLSRTDRGRSECLRIHLLEPLIALLHSEETQIARQAADALFQLSQTRSARMHVTSRSLRSLRSLNFRADSRVANLVSRVLQRLEYGGVNLALSPQRSLLMDSRAPLSV